MALYEFKCKNCGEVYEHLDLNSDPNMKRPCPKCRTSNGKIMSNVNVVLKEGGVGWAKHGYSRQYSIADGPENKSGDRHKRSGKTVVPVRGGLSIEPDKDTSKKKKPMIKVKK